jgi:hypothetical protein
MEDTDSDQGRTTLDPTENQSANVVPSSNTSYNRAYDDLPRSFSGRAIRRGQGTRTPRASEPGGPTLGVGDAVGAGDSYMVADLLPEDLANVAFDKLKAEVKWNTMYHRGA